MPPIEISLEQIAQTEALTHSLIDSIPPSLYFEKDTAKKLKRSKHKATNEKVKNKNLTKQEKQKLAKLDPKINKPISQILDNFEATTQVSDNESEDENTSHYAKRKRKNRKRKYKDDPEIQSKRRKIEESEEHKELKLKLKQRLAEFKSKRELSGKNIPKKLKKKIEKQSEIKVKKEKRKEKMKIKIKEKLKEKRGEPIKPAEDKAKVIKKPNIETIAKAEVKKEISVKVKKPAVIEPSKPIEEKPQKVKFNVEFNKAEDKGNEFSKNPQKKARFTLSNPRDNLAQVQKAKRKMEKLKEKAPEKAKIFEEKQGWDKAIKKAQGLKIRDNEAILKKSIRKRDLIKKKSKKAWDKRIQNVGKMKKERQERRTANIQKWKDEKLKKKIKKRK